MALVAFFHLSTTFILKKN